MPKSCFEFVEKNILNCSPPPAIPALQWPAGLRLLALAPHPDDFDSIGVTLRFFRDNGNPIHLLVVSGSASGVLDEFCGTPDPDAKTAVREREQRNSLEFFGLPDDRVEFMHLPEDNGGAPIENHSNENAIAIRLSDWRPDIVFLPHGNDTNAGHHRVYAMFSRAAYSLPGGCAAFLIRDPKTLGMRIDTYMPFGSKEEPWKRQLLRYHVSQDTRNRQWRGHGFDDRILEVNRKIAAELSLGAEFAEAFEIEWAGPKELA
jgi:LmbE family N-acetylglucosaminyl deacetylase